MKGDLTYKTEKIVLTVGGSVPQVSSTYILEARDQDITVIPSGVIPKIIKSAIVRYVKNCERINVM